LKRYSPQIWNAINALLLHSLICINQSWQLKDIHFFRELLWSVRHQIHNHSLPQQHLALTHLELQNASGRTRKLVLCCVWQTDGNNFDSSTKKGAVLGLFKGVIRE